MKDVGRYGNRGEIHALGIPEDISEQKWVLFLGRVREMEAFWKAHGAMEAALIHAHRLLLGEFWMKG